MKRIICDQHEQIATWVFSKIPMATLGDSPYTAIGLFDRRGYITAGTVYCNYTERDVYMHHAQLNPRSLTLHYLREAFRYPFDQLRVHRVTATVAEGNAASLRFVRHLGFVDEGRVREYFENGDDAIILGMLRSECRLLSGAPHGKHDRRPAATSSIADNLGERPFNERGRRVPPTDRRGSSTLILGAPGQQPPGNDRSPAAAGGRR